MGRTSSKLSSPGGLKVGVGGKSGATKSGSTTYAQGQPKQPFGKGKIPGGMEKYTAHGAGTTPPGTKSATIGSPLAGGSVSPSNARSVKKMNGGGHGNLDPLDANNRRTFGPVQKAIEKKTSATGQSQVTMKSPTKQPKASGVPANKPQNLHMSLGFGGKPTIS